jgi:acid phosphatase family membrane protein YuiD
MGWPVVSIYLLTPFCAWIVAQLAKLLLQGRKRRGIIDASHLYRSGGMPSAHTAVVVSLATAVGFGQGFSSVSFAISVVVALVVVYDSVNVRYIVGEQGRVLEKLLARDKQLSQEIIAPPIIRGHTVPEVIAGTVVGAAVAFIILLL